ncbi:hypothetical protein P0082_06745 [Candidatus Haliotispira prima]|uniref:Tetratricopeptide repeat protein n=1 Tax=Candidatus Haliotispira prima TaxID=3034016 RepID=A0ABY8ME42_9SPIO|nr:hypothetical protein P0082_06745 [Candidatus Haliotispira prima]
MAENQTLLNHQRSRNLNREGYSAYRKENWSQALRHFARSMKLDPYYTYPIYNTACVLSLRGRPEDSYRIYRLLLEVLLQESGEMRSVHMAKMQRDPDLAWFRSHEPELFILLNNVILNYESQEIYGELRQNRAWDIETSAYSRADVVPLTPRASGYSRKLKRESTSRPGNSDPNFEIRSVPDGRVKPSVSSSSWKTIKTTNTSKTKDITDTPDTTETKQEAEPDIGYTVPPEEREDSITVTPYDDPFGGGDDLFGQGLDEETLFGNDGDPTKGSDSKVPGKPSNDFSNSFDPFADDDGSQNPFDNDDLVPQNFPGFDEEESDGFFLFVPQSLKRQYEDSKLTLNLISQQAVPTRSVPGTGTKDGISFNGYRYTWRFHAGGKLFEMRGFFVIRGNVLVLETFASNPEKLKGLPFDWASFRSLFFIYQPQINEFHALTLTGERIRIY